MRLADLHPTLEGALDDGVLLFDCPLGHGHRMRVILGAGGWSASGSFPDTLTVLPSIDASPLCWHGTITNGALV